MPRYEVEVCYQIIETRCKRYAVSAGDPDEAEGIAADKFYEEHDEEIDGMVTRKIGERY